MFTSKTNYFAPRHLLFCLLRKHFNQKTKLLFFPSSFLFFPSYTEILQIAWKCFSVKYSPELFSCVFIEKCLELSCTALLFRRKRSIGKLNLLWQRFQISVCGNYQVQLRRMVCFLIFFFFTNCSTVVIFFSVCNTFLCKPSKFQICTVLLGCFVGVITLLGNTTEIERLDMHLG